MIPCFALYLQMSSMVSCVTIFNVLSIGFQPNMGQKTCPRIGMLINSIRTREGFLVFCSFSQQCCTAHHFKVSRSTFQMIFIWIFTAGGFSVTISLYYPASLLHLNVAEDFWWHGCAFCHSMRSLSLLATCR